MAGAGTFAMTSPFTPSVQNVIPAKYLGTTVGALPVQGMIVGLCTAVFVTWYMHKQANKCRENGEHFIPLPSDVEIPENSKRPNMVVSFIPLVTLIIVLNVFKFSIEASLFTAIFTALICYFPYFPKNINEMWKRFTGSNRLYVRVIPLTSNAN